MSFTEPQPALDNTRTRRPWEPPCITLERPIELRTRAQQAPGPVTGGPWNPGNLGPLSTSGGGGGCL